VTLTKTERMRRIKSSDTIPELAVRCLLHSIGYRCRLHRADLPGKPDIVFPARRQVILVHGCFWHQHSCVLGRIPKGNQSYWIPKLSRNVQRDKDVRRQLRALGWRVLAVWECQVKKPGLTSRLKRFLQ
jgi:DNA mismatch endonuclease, patch repair protein